MEDIETKLNDCKWKTIDNFQSAIYLRNLTCLLIAIIIKCHLSKINWFNCCIQNFYTIFNYFTNTGKKPLKWLRWHGEIVDLCLKESWPKIIWKFGFPRETNERSWENRDDTEKYRLISSIGFAFASSITCLYSLFQKLMF